MCNIATILSLYDEVMTIISVDDYWIVIISIVAYQIHVVIVNYEQDTKLISETLLVL